ncbi:hypothetical protein DSM112329_00823 [Paraconexibacter sp. AEG42_29]|uniref:HTH tetR-type domain-containing protein n=1 Tax=Paraconexibacter sp. AEG42_29 TaxID=2997339 RepID=A0AAU7AQR1_9ACTN
MGRTYAGQTAEERADARRRQLLDAGLELLGTRGVAESTVRGVCDEAGLSTRFFYESFTSLDALALAVYDEAVDATITAVVEAVRGAGTSDAHREARAHAAIAAMVAALTDDPRRARVVLREASASTELAQRRQHTMQRFAAVITMLGHAEYGLPDGAAPIVPITAAFVAGGVSELMIAWVEGDVPIPRERLVEDCARLLIGIGDTARAIAGP